MTFPNAGAADALRLEALSKTAQLAFVLCLRVEKRVDSFAEQRLQTLARHPINS
jgi:hypothetical protein